MELLLETAKKGKYTFFKPAGDLNYEGALRLKNAFQEASEKKEKYFILDLKNCRTISSFALSVILKLNDTIKESDGAFKLICPGGDVSDIFDVIDIRNIIPFYSSEEELWQQDGKDNSP